MFNSSLNPTVIDDMAPTLIVTTPSNSTVQVLTMPVKACLTRSSEHEANIWAEQLFAQAKGGNHDGARFLEGLLNG